MRRKQEMLHLLGGFPLLTHKQVFFNVMLGEAGKPPSVGVKLIFGRL